MFGREYSVPLDVMYGTSKEVPRYSQVGDYIEMLQKLHEVARNNMSVHQSGLPHIIIKKLLTRSCKWVN